MSDTASAFAAPIAQSIWDMKYRLKQADGTPIDADIDATWDRIAGALAAPESDAAAHEATFRAALQDFRFLPAGRIVAGAGTDRSVTLFNCFVMGTIDDDMGAIFGHLREAALTLQQGGGIGYDFSTIRPKGAAVAGVAADASGPLSFMDVWDAMCRTIMSAGSRRGAMMATLRCDHPDIEAFVAAKSDAARLRMFNMSVLVTDPFMDAVAADADWPLVFKGQTYKTLRARDLWDAIMRATYDYAEPGVIFIDRINQTNNLSYVESIAATNPCGEQPLPPYGACLLGSINLARLVQNPFNGTINDTELADLTATAIRMMDNVVDASRFPLPQQEDEARAKRRIGLGVTGLADALAMCGLTYGTPEAAAQTGKWLQTIANAAYRASALLAAEKGAFPLYSDALLAAPMIARLDEDTRALVAQHGLRNALLTSIAPTGTISLLAGNVSSGIEPIFATEYSRKVLLDDGSHREEVVQDYAVAEWRRLHGETPLPDTFVTAQTLTPGAHIAMQAAAQDWVDSSISKTINVPADIAFETFKDVYMQAWQTGCKGCTTYRPNAVTGSVLSVAEERPQGRDEGGEVVQMFAPLDRPENLEGQTYKLRWPNSEHALYITINDITLDGRQRPFEIFVNSKNMEHFAWMVGLTRMISAVFRRGGDVSFVVEELKAVFDPRGGAWIEGKYVPSILAAIGGAIERHMIAIGFLGAEGAGLKLDPALQAMGGATVTTSAPLCPNCGAAELHKVEGCATCGNCGFSECG